jgi:1-acyl-sn-glycerol-3-phosphate acyltransferase
VNHWITRRSRSSGYRAALGGVCTRRAAISICALLTRLVFLVIAELRIDDVDIVPDADRGVIIASNHRSLLDFFVGTVAFRQCGVYPLTFVRADFFARPVLGRALRLVGAIPAGHGRSASSTLKEACEVLGIGGIITIAPDGRVVPPEQRPSGLGKLRGGVGIMSSRYGTPILLAAMRNTDKAWPPNRRTPILRLPWNRPKITVSFTWLSVQAGATPANVTRQVTNGLRTLLEIAEGDQGHQFDRTCGESTREHKWQLKAR